MSCDVDVRAALLQNIVVVGNGSGIKGLTERLDMELAKLMPSVSYLSSFYLSSSSVRIEMGRDRMSKKRRGNVIRWKDMGNRA
jgi:actin-related protein